MTRWLRRTVVACCFATVTLSLTSDAAAQNSLPAARDLYAAAAYEDALQMLNSIRTTEQRPDNGAVEQYRALCLVALGRMAEAESAIESLVQVAPSYRLTDADVSPRVRTAFHDVRRRVLPAVIQRTYETANAAFARKDPAAAEGFRLVLELLADPDLGALATQSPLSELRTLAAGFLALGAAQTPAPIPAAAPPPAPQPPAPPPPAPVPAPARIASNRIYGPEDVNVMPPIVARQSFAPLADVFAVHPGIVEVVVDEIGEVVAAKTVVSVNTVYDRIALATARSWRYRPATLDGVAVKYRTIVQLQLKSR
jgi:hypothetical protein